MDERTDRDALDEALALEARAQQALQDGDPEASALFVAAAGCYRESWDLAGPRSFGRLIGMLKAAILGGEGENQAHYAIAELHGEADSPASSYALALARLATGDDDGAAHATAGMRPGGDAFVRAADAIDAIARGDAAGYTGAIDAIVADFTARSEHLTGVRIADTALMLDRLAGRRGLPTHTGPALPG